ncbi:CSLREA domain-containing protein [Nevskia sp.]|uniref:CSLREA domain-containing protein n=1 Tax=Nevskia sp. TaxID=1929292 RepID=UPI0025FB52EA|nr:CSLREA domain-containing protein [Nevskia sp.]
MNQNLATTARHCAITMLLSTALLPLQAALAADIVVSKFTDSLDGSCNSDCSLREAVQLANQTPGASRIVLAAGTYSLSLPPPGGIDRIAEALPGAVATLSKLTVRNGSEPHGGGGLRVNAGATLSLQSAAVSGSSVGSSVEPAFGGGIFNEGTLNIDASRIDGNGTSAGDSYPSGGGGIYNKGSLTVRDARFISNDVSNDDDAGLGGALYNKGAADIRRATFENNRTGHYGSGAAILNAGTGTLRLENSTLSDNTSFTDTFFYPGPAGAIENGDRLDGPTASARLINVTIAGNNDYGLINRARISITNSIIAGNGPVEDPDQAVVGKDENCLNEGVGTQFSQTGLLRGTDSGNCPSTLLVLNADSFVTLMYPLALNNWQSPTFALRPGSIAVDAAVGSCPSTDQRRVTRPRDGNGDGIAACDLGAYERPKP